MACVAVLVTACGSSRNVEGAGVAETTTFGQWELASYQNGAWTQTWSGAVLIETGAGGGLMLRSTHAPGFYVLRARGVGSATLRVTLPGEEPVYLPAPASGSVTPWYLDLESPGVVEALIYADEPRTYRLQSLDLSPCLDCTTASQLRARILSDLGVPATGTATFAERLLEWTARTVKDGSGASGAMLMLAPPGQFYDYWRRDAGGGMCGHFSAFLIGVLNLFGIQGMTVDMSLAQGQDSHVTVVAAMPAGPEGRYRFYVLDPTLNGLHVARASGQPADIAAVLADEPAHEFVTRPVVREAVYVGEEIPDGDVIRTTRGNRVTRRVAYTEPRTFWGEDLLADAAERDPMIVALRERRLSVGYGTPAIREAFERLLNGDGGQF